MSYKKRPKNKQEISPNSGTGRKKALPRKLVLAFEFTYNDQKYGLGNGRIKVSDEGGISCLIRDEEGKWKPVKGAILRWVELKSVIIKRESKKK